MLIRFFHSQGKFRAQARLCTAFLLVLGFGQVLSPAYAQPSAQDMLRYPGVDSPFAARSIVAESQQAASGSDAPLPLGAAPEKTDTSSALPLGSATTPNEPANTPPLTVSTDSSKDAAAEKKETGVDKPHGNVMPLEPPPLPTESRLESAIQNEAERAYYDQKKRRYENTYERAYEGLVPLGPNEIRETMSRYERTQRAAVPPASGQPRGQVRIKTLSLEPGSEPPTINVASGYVTTIAIVDATGEPWPILDMGIGGNFEISKTGGGAMGSHVVRVMPLTRFGYGNLSVILQDLPTPIIFKLATGGTTVDYRFDARVPRLGPNAKVSLIDRKNSLRAGSAEIMTFLDNAPPPHAKRVRVNGADARTLAWTVDSKMFVRTPLTLISPSWDASVSSADGTTVYELTETPVLLMSDGGTLVRARIAQKEEN